MIKLHTNYGDITLELDSEKAPLTVQNFVDYVNSGNYDIRHRYVAREGTTPPRRGARDLLDHVHSPYDFAKHSIAVALGGR